VDRELDEAAGAIERETNDAEGGARMAADRVWEPQVETDSEEGATLGDVTPGLGVIAETPIGWGSTWDEDNAESGEFGWRCGLICSAEVKGAGHRAGCSFGDLHSFCQDAGVDHGK